MSIPTDMTEAILTAPATPVEFFQWWQDAAEVFRQRGMTADQLVEFRTGLIDRFHAASKYSIAPTHFGLNRWSRTCAAVSWTLYCPSPGGVKVAHPLYPREIHSVCVEEVQALVDFVVLLNRGRPSVPGSYQIYAKALIA